MKELLIKDLRDSGLFVEFTNRWILLGGWEASEEGGNGFWFDGPKIEVNVNDVPDITAHDDYLLDVLDPIDNAVIEIFESYGYILCENGVQDETTLSSVFYEKKYFVDSV